MRKLGLTFAMLLMAGVCHAQSFGGSFVINGSRQTAGFPAVMVAPANLTVDSCVAAFARLGDCAAFPNAQIVDETAHKLICFAQGQPGDFNFEPETVIGLSIPVGDVVAVVMASQPVGCRQNNSAFSISISYH